MVAVTQNVDDTFLKFKNVGGYLKLQLYGDDVIVKTITLQGNSNEKIAGTATITATYGGNPTVSMTDDATETITLDCGEGVKIGTTEETATAFWFVVPPTRFESGFEITITNLNGGTLTKSTSKEIIVDRNLIKPMNAFELKDFIAIAEYHVETAGTLATLIGDENKNILTSVKISGNLNATDICYLREMAGSNYYGAQVTEVGVLKKLDISDASIVEEEGDVTYLWNGIGDGQYSFKTKNNEIGPFMFCRTKLEKIILPTNITSIADCAFHSCENLKEITFPNGLTQIGKEAFKDCI